MAAAGAALALLAFPAHAAVFSTVIAFGDSLSDNGQSLTGRPVPPAPYVGGRFSNGPVAVEYLANAMGANLFDYAVSGATSGTLNTDFTDGQPLRETGVARQVDKFQADLGGAAADPVALYLVSGGSNDFLAIDPGDAAAVAQTAGDVVSNLDTALMRLYNLGARNFLLPLLPDLGMTPLAAGMGLTAELSQLSADFNALLADSYDMLRASMPDARLVLFDSAASQNGIDAGAPGNGFVNLDDACFDSAANTVCASPDSYFFWDQEHPSTAGYAALGADLLRALPEPSSGLLSALALLVLVRRGRRPGATVA
jgi:phospholipase/lecithinase/hemolysin